MNRRRNIRGVRLPPVRSRSLLLFTASLALAFLAPAGAASVQSADVLRLERPVTFELAPGEAREFALPLREGEFAEVFWLANDELQLTVDVAGPKGVEDPQRSGRARELLRLRGTGCGGVPPEFRPPRVRGGRRAPADHAAVPGQAPTSGRHAAGRRGDSSTGTRPRSGSGKSSPCLPWRRPAA